LSRNSIERLDLPQPVESHWLRPPVNDAAQAL
jgi:hypothetical protein